MEGKENNSGYGISGGIGKWLSLVLVLLSVYLVAISVKEFKSIAYVGDTTPVKNTITVSGKGEAVGIPDIATFSFSVQTESKVVADAQSSSAKKINDIMAYLKKSGIDDKDIKTTGYDIYPRYDYQTDGSTSSYYPPSGKQVLAAYVVNQSITVKIRTTGDAGKILSGVGSLGATNISGINFTFDKEDALNDEARTKAITDAKSKAETLASELGVKLVRIVSYSENGSYPPVYYAKTDSMVVGAGAMAPSPAIPVGENTVTSNVSITYEVR